MKIVGWQLLRLVNEAQRDLVGVTIEAIRSDPSTGRLLLLGGSRRGKRLIVIGTRGSAATFYWTRKKSDLPGQDLYSHSEKLNRIRNARLNQIELPAADRWMRISLIRRTRDDQEPTPISLVVSWIGTGGNVHLLNQDDRVMESWFADSAAAVGSVFTPVNPPDMIDWRNWSFPEYQSHRHEHANESLSEFLSHRAWGIDRALAKEIEARVNTPRVASPRASEQQGQWDEFSIIMDTLRTAVDPETPIRMPTLLPVDKSGLTGEDAGDWSGSLAEAIARLDATSQQTSSTDAALAQIKSEAVRRMRQVQRRLKSAQNAIEHGREAGRLKRGADVLNAQRHLLVRGGEQVTVTDWESGDQITIKLNKARSPQENIDAAYRRARDAARAAELALTQLPELERQSAELDRILNEIAEGELSEARIDQLCELFTIADRSVSGRKRQPRRVPYREFLLGTVRVLVGKSSRDNDELTMKIARPQDLFLHARGVPGSHVILQSTDGKPPDEPTINRAARIAAFFSRAKHSGLVPVACTEARYVRKQRKSPPGTVSVERERVIMVQPQAPAGYHGEAEA